MNAMLEGRNSLPATSFSSHERLSAGLEPNRFSKSSNPRPMFLSLTYRLFEYPFFRLNRTLPCDSVGFEFIVSMPIVWQSVTEAFDTQFSRLTPMLAAAYSQWVDIGAFLVNSEILTGILSFRCPGPWVKRNVQHRLGVPTNLWKAFYLSRLPISP